MKCPPLLANEKERLKALADYGLDGDRPLPSLASVVQIASHVFGMPVAAVNMVGDTNVFLAASCGLDNVTDIDLSRDVSFCAHAITGDDVMVVPDTALDERFHDNHWLWAARVYAFTPVFRCYRPKVMLWVPFALSTTNPATFPPMTAHAFTNWPKWLPTGWSCAAWKFPPNRPAPPPPLKNLPKTPPQRLLGLTRRAI